MQTKTKFCLKFNNVKNVEQDVKTTKGIKKNKMKIIKILWRKLQMNILDYGHTRKD